MLRMTARVPLVVVALMAAAFAVISITTRSPTVRILFGSVACLCVVAVAVGLRQPSRAVPWLWGIVAAFLAILAFAPVLCVTQNTTYEERVATEVTRCTGLLPVPSNVLLMVVTATAAFIVGFRLCRRRVPPAS